MTDNKQVVREALTEADLLLASIRKQEPHPNIQLAREKLVEICKALDDLISKTALIEKLEGMKLEKKPTSMMAGAAVWPSANYVEGYNTCLDTLLADLRGEG